MFKLYSALLLFGIICNLTVAVEVKAKEKVYYKHTESTAAVEPESGSKDVVPPYIMEIQPSPSSSPFKLNSAKVNSIQETMKKESKIKPRKGVLNNKLSDTDERNNTALLNSTSETLKLKAMNTTNIAVQQTNITNHTFANSSKVPTSTKKPIITHIAPVKEEVQEEEVAPETIRMKAIRKPKPKPEVTVGEKDADQPIPASPTIKSPLGIPRKMEYIIPVAITLTALPLLGAAFYVLYKRGRDYWDKRHYRRMDFLVDGMYNE